MYFLYSIIYGVAFFLLTPLFLIRRKKYASGFLQRAGNYSAFRNVEGPPVIWLHCVSVGETNAAQPLVHALSSEFSDHRLVISTTTQTGQELAQKLFADKAQAICYLPFDFKHTVRRALDNFRPTIVLLMETEIWPRLIHEAKAIGAKVGIVNGRLSQRSFQRYSKIGFFISRVLGDIDLALMQTQADADRMIKLGVDKTRVEVTGNVKFDQSASPDEAALTEYFRNRFDISGDRPLVIAASTHDPEERYVIEALGTTLHSHNRLMIAPRHPERFDAVEKLIRDSGHSFVRRSSPASGADRDAEIILLDTIGELRAAYPLAEIVFVGGSLIPHGGQSVIEPASVGKAIVTGPHTHNFEAVIEEFTKGDALMTVNDEKHLAEVISVLTMVKEVRATLGSNAMAVMDAKRDAIRKTIEGIRKLSPRGND